MRGTTAGELTGGLVRGLLVVALLAGISGAADAGIQPASLTCEYLSNPLGIDVIHPRLSWVLESTQAGERGQSQTACRVLVASSEAGLAEDRGDLWDSGTVTTDQSVHVEYAGKPLESHQRCYWKVRAWDETGEPSAWSQPALWTMGILTPEEWGAEWVTYARALEPLPGDAEPGPRLSLRDCQWIWGPGAVAETEVPAGVRQFRRTVVLPADAEIDRARIALTVDDQFRAWVNGIAVGKSDGESYAWRRPQEIDITAQMRAGRTVIAIEATNAALSPAGLVGVLAVEMANGERVTVRTDGAWLTTLSAPDGWEAADFDDAGWDKAAELGQMGIAPWATVRVLGSDEWAQTFPSPLLRKRFTVDKPLRAATLYISGLGFHEARLNGEKIGDHVLDPTFTDYEKRVLYATHDVTAQVRAGDNVLGVMLGNGWYNQHARAAWDFDRAAWRDRPKLLAHLRLEFADGTVQSVVTDDSWRASNGPLVHDGIRNGEVYDARRELPGWDAPGFDEAAWDEVSAANPPRGVLHSQMMPPVRIMQTLKPVKMTEPKPGAYLFDMGQNLAGWVRLRASGPAGTKVTLRYGERLKSDGQLETAQIEGLVYGAPFQTDTYILRGDGEEVWEPRFTYHGFQYVQITGLPEPPTLDTVQARIAHTAFTTAGSFECSNDLLNTIQRLTLWAYRSNFLGYPTDCPHREKNGWTGDAHLAAELGMLNFHNAAAYTKWTHDLEDAQRENGDLPGIVPTGGWGYGTGPAWDSAALLVPWYLYQYQGDVRILAEQYDTMKRYVDYLGTREKDRIVSYGLGDWVPADTVTPAAVTSTAYYFVDALIVAETARLLGKTEDQRKYAALAAEIRRAFNDTFYRGDGVYANGSQTALSCAIYQGLVAPDEQTDTVDQLVEAVKGRDWHLDTGILGAKYLFHALTDNGRVDVAYRIATQTTFPSYGDWIARGATTLWEDWRGGASLNHIMFGDISAWFYQALAGINVDPANPGFKRVIIRPRPVGDLTWARAEHESVYGTIKSAWRLENGVFTLDVTVPVNASAEVWVPAGNPAAASEGDGPAADASGVEFLRMDDGCAVFAVGSGRYTFTARE